MPKAGCKNGQFYPPFKRAEGSRRLETHCPVFSIFTHILTSPSNKLDTSSRKN